MAQSNRVFCEIPPTPIEEKPTVDLAIEILQAVRSHYGRRPRGRAAVFEALNALAGATAEIIAGCDGDAQEFFEEALDQCLDGR